MTNCSLMKVEKFAECSPLIFDLYKAIIDLEKQFSVFLRVTDLHRFYSTANGGYHVTRRGCSLCHGMFTQIKLCFSSTIVK